MLPLLCIVWIYCGHDQVNLSCNCRASNESRMRVLTTSLSRHAADSMDPLLCVFERQVCNNSTLIEIARQLHRSTYKEHGGMRGHYTTGY